MQGGTFCFTEMIKIHPKWDPGPDPQGGPLLLLRGGPLLLRGGPLLLLVDLLVDAGISSSKRQAREDLGNGAIYINGDRCTDLDRSMRTADGLHGRYIIIRRGKNKYFLVK